MRTIGTALWLLSACATTTPAELRGEPCTEVDPVQVNADQVTLHAPDCGEAWLQPAAVAEGDVELEVRTNGHAVEVVARSQRGATLDAVMWRGGWSMQHVGPSLQLHFGTGPSTGDGYTPLEDAVTWAADGLPMRDDPTESAWATAIGSPSTPTLVVGALSAAFSETRVHTAGDELVVVQDFRDDPLLVPPGGTATLEPLYLNIGSTGWDALTHWALEVAATQPPRPLRLRPGVALSIVAEQHEPDPDVVAEHVAAALKRVPDLELVILSAPLTPWTFEDMPEEALEDIAGMLRAESLALGIRMAPFRLTPDTNVPDAWRLTDTQQNPVHTFDGAPLLDGGNRAVHTWLASGAERLAELGVHQLDLLELDDPFVDGARPTDMGRIEAYRSSLDALVRGAPDLWYVAHDAPTLPTIGLVDAVQITPGAAAASPQRAAAALSARGFAHGLWWWHDLGDLPARLDNPAAMSGDAMSALLTGGGWTFPTALAEGDPADVTTHFPTLLRQHMGYRWRPTHSLEDNAQPPDSLHQFENEVGHIALWNLSGRAISVDPPDGVPLYAPDMTEDGSLSTLPPGSAAVWSTD